LSDSQESTGSPEPEVRPELAPVRQPHYEARRSAPPPERAREFRPAEPSAVAKAIEEVNEIVDSLRSALDEMEDVLESLEAVERQKEADEHEIESLRRSLRQLHRPRDSSQRR
jgi:predicted RNase H-like nuclease (RuvC/YqgF family)